MFFTIAAPAQKKQPGTLSWEIAAQLPQALGLAGPVSGVSNSALIVAGGNNFPDAMPWLGGKKKYYDTVYVFNKVNNKIVLNNKRWSLPAPVAYAAVCSTPLGVLYAGGENENGISNKAVLMVWDASTQNIVIKQLPDLPTAVTNAAATVHGQIVYIAGGENTSVTADNLYCLALDDIKEGWKSLPVIPVAVSNAVAVVQSDGIHDWLYLLGGRKKTAAGISDLYSSVFAFDLVTQQWTQKKSLPFSLSAGTGIAYAKNFIFLFCGDKGNTFHPTEMLIAAMLNEKDPAKKEILNQQKIKLQSAHPGFSREILRYNTQTGVCNIAGVIPFHAPVTTNAILWDNDIVVAGGEIKAGVRTANVLLGRFKQ